MSAAQETAFEKRRGVSKVEVRHGYARVHLSQIEQHLMQERLRALRYVSEREISIDFLKLTPTGLSFIVPDAHAQAVHEALQETGLHFSVKQGRSIVLVHAVNIRDEEGLIANILKTTISTCTQVDHVGDMHDRLLMVVKTESVDAVLEQFRSLDVEVMA
jgi:aspartokinase